MDLADDVAYSVHDVEDGVVAGRIDLTAHRPSAAVWATVRDWYLPDASTTTSSTTRSTGLRAQAAGRTTPYDGSRGAPGRAQEPHQRPDRAVLRRASRRATFAATDGPFVRYAADLVVPETTRLEIAVLKGIAAHYVMRAEDRVDLMARQRELLAELVEALLDRGPDALDRRSPSDWRGGRRRRRPGCAW